jgi:hypothetical protein
MARMEEITRKNNTLANNVMAVGNRSGKKFRNALTRAGFSIPRRKSTKKTEFARPREPWMTEGHRELSRRCLNLHWTRYRKTRRKGLELGPPEAAGRSGAGEGEQRFEWLR